jgi:hypothetical protein
MYIPDSYTLHLGARALRTRHMRIAWRRVLRALRRWWVHVLFRPLFEPLSAQ